MAQKVFNFMVSVGLILLAINCYMNSKNNLANAQNLTKMQKDVNAYMESSLRKDMAQLEWATGITKQVNSLK